MKCIVLYGPPAVGKQSVAEELLKTVPAHVLDNSRIIDIVQPLIGRDNPEFVGLVYSLQLQLINAAIRLTTQDIIVTFTFSASSQPDVAFIQTILEAGQRHNVKVELIHLTAKRRALLERVAQASRKAAGKLDNPEILNSMFEQYDMESPYPNAQSAQINTTHLTVAEVAQQVLRTTKD
jgi:RNase adaptor protein for sRNA GlmZ degradation